MDGTLIAIHRQLAIGSAPGPITKSTLMELLGGPGPCAKERENVRRIAEFQPDKRTATLDESQVESEIQRPEEIINFFIFPLNCHLPQLLQPNSLFFHK